MTSTIARPIPLAEPWLPPQCAEAVSRQVTSTFVGPGLVVQEFGGLVAACCEVFAAIPVTSGTIALSVAAHILGLRPGDEIIVPAYGVVSVINGFAWLGCSPRLVEIDVETASIDPNRLEEAITARTKAVAFVDFCGSIGPEIDAVNDICKSKGVPLVEDAAWALGRGQPGRRGGSFGTIGTTSFSVAKVVTTGQGGAVLAHFPHHRDAAIRVIDQGDTDWRRTNLNRGIGSNLRLSDLSAALGMVQLEQLEERLERKRRAYAVLANRLNARLFRASDGEPPMQNIVFTIDPDALVVRLRKAGILATRQYRPMYHHPPYAHLNDRHFPASEFWFAHSVYLPFGLGLSEEQAERIGDAVVSADVKLLDAPSGRNGGEL